MLKHSCLERARRKRQEVISRHRHDDSPSSTQSNDAARQVVQEELRECGVGIIRGGLCLEGNEPMLHVVMDDDDDDDEYAISEAELYKLMQEVQEELQRDGKCRCYCRTIYCRSYSMSNISKPKLFHSLLHSCS